ncbi:MAG: FliH/SctL family protein [Bdellovibrionales bacterium]
MATPKSVLKKEASSNVVFDFKAREFPLVVSASANEFISGQNFQSTDFQINPLAAEQAGIAKLQRDALNDKIEEEALLQLKSVQEKAYKEAYELGLTEGREQAFQAERIVLENKLRDFDQLLTLFNEMKSKLVADHEAHIIEMIYRLASRIAMREIKQDAESIMPVVMQVVADAQSDEQLTIHVSSSDHDFLELVRSKTGKAADALKRVRVEISDGVTSGGCLLESNYGSIDATVEMRVNRAWETLKERLPKEEQRTPPSEGSGTAGGEGHGT